MWQCPNCGKSGTDLYLKGKIVTKMHECPNKSKG